MGLTGGTQSRGDGTVQTDPRERDLKTWDRRLCVFASLGSSGAVTTHSATSLRPYLLSQGYICRRDKRV